MSTGQINTLLDLWAATLIKHQDSPPFTGHWDLYETIDSTPLGNVTWETFSMSYNGEKPANNVPPQMAAKYNMWFCDPHLLVHHMLSNPDFTMEIKYVPYQDYTNEDKCCYKNFFSEDPETHGSAFVPPIVGSNKTTVSVATGHTEYHPLYLSIGNIFNGVQRTHHNGVVLVGLAIPKSTKEHLEDKDFCNLHCQIFHSSLTKIFDSVKPNMTIPNVVHCPDSHYWHVIYGLGLYIANYPEQLVLLGVVQNWCPKCLNHRRNLKGDGPSLLWCREHTNLLIQELKHANLWYDYGIIQEVMPFINDFPQVDIHELLLPDLLHQIIKGTFKDHLVDWVEDYLYSNRIAAVAPFAARQHSFKQWTGDDSKALMKVYLPAIKGHVPQDVVHTFSAFLDFCYIVRQDMITEDDLIQLQDVLDWFHQYHKIFKTMGVVLGFSFLRQHSLNHYSLMIRLYGALNSLCSSITESKHIKAVKEPWHHSNRYKALGQMLLTNQHLNKIAAAQSDFDACGNHKSLDDYDDGDNNNDNENDDAPQAHLNHLCVNELQNQTAEGDAANVIDGPTVQAHVELAVMPMLGGAHDVSALMHDLKLPNFPTMIQQFLHNQLHITDHEPPKFDPATAPAFMGRVFVFSSAAASFYAPSDLSGTGGMQRKHIQATTSWQGGPARNDCIFVSMNDKVNCGLDGLAIVRVLHFLVVHWFAYITDSWDPDTGMYLITSSSHDDGTPDISIIHIDCIFCAAHLIPLYGANFLPHEIGPHDSYNMFHAFYVNKYADHHAFEVA
ncbi:uncharacterized protein BJ212DRAFT_1447696 [Suillus subaureus]|uniref:Uncharacterized protein n=1 Tax=Suillus subaureus TaxID=48587 RepID=A0A9P7JC81_9AGAM|nr:uncharacterized protein BJ212DRAFT_1447696 [Suillus subaureus]KAG1813895.1 hypothetical protein BJ212DRAFT_1447696 [Suillus subaureus]